ncbi:superoxide dismutase [Cu-Zn]-like [Euwallacea fornicatus]|uniref:superoxide dismutase [Cu-Zn]-like n=1 Tax=Euwallacea fornicatus TaxID=995702 RepID=UPI00338F0093
MFLIHNYTYMIMFPTFLCVIAFLNGSVRAEELQESSDDNMVFGELGHGKPLTIKSYPAIENYQSDVYEVYQVPFSFELRHLAAVAVLTSEDEDDVKGEIVFLQKHHPSGPVFIRGNVTGLSSGKHGLHIHQSGDLREGCSKLGGHFNPYLLHHGGPKSPIRHVGDLGNIEAKEGVAEIVTIDPLMSLAGGSRGVVGRALVLTEGEDDLGKGENANSLVDGNAGKPIACGIIAYIT